MYPRSISLLLVFFFIGFSQLQTRILTVPGEYATIKLGILDASEGDTVMVSPGTYHEYNITYYGKTITVMSTDPEDSSIVASTIIDADSLGPVFVFFSREGNTSVLKGFTITGGYHDDGGGIALLEDSNPTITHNVITGNLATSGGGGISCYSSDPHILNNVINNNKAYYSGGGICCNVFSYPLLEDNLIANNEAEYGGGIYCYRSSRPIIRKNIIEKNTASSRGGGICCFFYSSATINDCNIRENSAGDKGGGIYFSEYNQWSHLRIEGTIITDNYATNAGGGIYCIDYCAPDIINSVIYGNRSLQSGGGMYCSTNSTPKLVNTVVWNNSPHEIYFDETELPNVITVTHSDIRYGEEGIVTNNNGMINWLEGNISMEPKFVDPVSGDFSLLAGSPCIDSGTAFFEWEGDTLIFLSPNAYVGDAPDMGAIEYGVTGISDDAENVRIPLSAVLHQNYPNPFNPTTTIQFDIPGDPGTKQNVNLTIYNIRGKRVKTLINNCLETGSHKLLWDGTGDSGEKVTSGIYFYNLKCGNKTCNRKMYLIK